MSTFRLNLTHRLFRPIYPALRALLLRNRLFLRKTTKPDQIRNFASAVSPQLTSRPLIRIGGAGDGGYLVPDDLSGVEICFSPGVSTTASFEEDLANRGVRSFLADYSVEEPPISRIEFEFDKKFLGVCDTDVHLRLESWVNAKAPDGTDFILQMDIEGAEYAVLLDSNRDTLRRFRILVIEFHNFDNICDPLGFEIINSTMTKLLQDFYVVHIHPNNWGESVQFFGLKIPTVMEFTFLRRDRAELVGPATQFPHPFDRPNYTDKPDLVLAGCWHK